MLGRLGYEIEKFYHTDKPKAPLEHFLEGKWVIKKDEGREEKFFEIWENISKGNIIY